MSQCDSKINSFFIILIIILLFYERIFSCCFFWFLGFEMGIGILWFSFCVLYCDGPRPELSVPLRFEAFTVLSTSLVLFHRLQNILINWTVYVTRAVFSCFPQSLIIRCNMHLERRYTQWNALKILYCAPPLL